MRQQEDKINQLLIHLFNKHGVKGEVDDDNKIILPDQFIKAYCQLYDKTSTDITVLQLDVIFVIGLGKEIIESCAGIGSNIDEAANDAFKNFVTNSFHVILAAFFSQKYDEQISREEWVIDNKKYDVISSHIGIRGQKPEIFSTKWIEQFNTTVQKQKLSGSIHWIRLFYAFSDNKVNVCEVLLDNNIWESVQLKSAKFDLPLSDNYYSVRLFFILQNGWDMSRLAAAIVWISNKYPEDDGEKIIEYFQKIGMSPLDAEMAYIMIPLAFSHAFLKRVVPNAITTKATIINAKKDSFEIDLIQNTFYIQTYEWAKQEIEKNLIEKESLIQLLIKSSTFNAFNEALNNGSQPEDLEFSGSVIYLDNYLINNDDLKVIERPKRKFFRKFW